MTSWSRSSPRWDAGRCRNSSYAVPARGARAGAHTTLLRTPARGIISVVSHQRIEIMSRSYFTRVALAALALPSMAYAPVPASPWLAEPIKYARYPHISSTGLIAFSYQDDIWVANEDGS